MSLSMLNKPLKPLAIAISVGVLGFGAHAEEAEENSEIESIVVVGQSTNTVITPEELEKYQANDLADIFRLVPSVSVGGSVGMAQKIYVRGVEDPQLNITVDGAPQTSTLFHHVGRVTVEPELLREVELQAGAGEATSGAGAIGGAIRFKTKSVNDLLEPGENFGGMIKAGYFSNDGYKTSSTLYGKLNDDWGLLGSYVYVDRDNMTDGDDKEILGTAAEQSIGFFKLNGELSGNQRLSLSYETREDEGDLSRRPNWAITAETPLYPIKSTRDTFVFNHDYTPSELINLESTVYHTESGVEQNGVWGRFLGEVTTYGFDVRNTSQVEDHSMTYGVEYRKDKVYARSLEEGGSPGTREEGDVLGVYFQDHWQINKDLLLSFGVRYDKYNLDQVTFGKETDSNGVSPNIGLNYDINDNWQLSLGYAEAMRGKEVGDSFTIERASHAVDLKPEEVDNTELSLKYHDADLQVTASVYRSNVNDVIMDQMGGAVYYENAGLLETDGYELKAAYWYEDLEVVASFSHNDSELNGHTVNGYEHIGLGNSRGDTWGLNTRYSVLENLELGWNYTYVEDLNDIEVFFRLIDIGWATETMLLDKKGYQTHDIYVEWQPLNDETLIVNLSVQNLLDEHYRDHSSVGDYREFSPIVHGLYEAGRDVRLTVSYKF